MPARASREDGAKPSRTRRCDRGRTPQTKPLPDYRWEGAAQGRSGKPEDLSPGGTVAALVVRGGHRLCARIQSAGIPDFDSQESQARDLLFVAADPEVSGRCRLFHRSRPAGCSPVAPFVRPASGLVREITAWQVFGFNVMNANIGIGLVWLTLLGPGLYPGANLYLAVLLAFAGILPLNFLYVRLAVAFPRSGGDYVSISRTLSPALGFAVNAAAMAYFCLFVGLGGLYTVQYGLTPLARVWAAYSGDAWALHLADRLATPTGTFLVSLAVLLAYALLMIGGGKLYFRAQSAAFVLGTAALAVVVAAGLLLSRRRGLAHIDGALARLGAGPCGAAGRRPGRRLFVVGHAARRHLAVDRLRGLLLLSLHRRRGAPPGAHPGARRVRFADLGPGLAARRHVRPQPSVRA